MAILSCVSCMSCMSWSLYLLFNTHKFLLLLFFQWINNGYDMQIFEKTMLRNYFATILSLFILLSNSIIADNAQDTSSLMQQQIKHVVILMLENRSFDNMLAWLYDEIDPPSHFIPANSDPLFLGLSESTLDQYTNLLKDSSGRVVFSCAPIKGIPSVALTKFINSPKFDPHETFPDVMLQMFGYEGSSEPTMSGFLQNYASYWHESSWMSQKDNICAIMETYTDKELPILYNLARHYAVSDLWFSSVPTQTNPNRAFSFCGTSEGEIINGFLAKNSFQSDTIWNRLSEQSPETTWSIFWQSDMLPAVLPGPYSGANSFASLNRIPHLQDHLQTIDDFHKYARNGQLPDISFLEPQWTISANLSAKEKNVLEFILPHQDFILGLQGNDLHPPGDVRTAENFLANVYTSLTSNKEAWNKTLLIIVFDEHGGLFDHIPPPTAIPPDDHFHNGFKFDRYGVRIPAIFISPLIEKGTVIRSIDPEIPFDHTSLIATILKWKNIDKSKWHFGRRVEQAPTFENVITLSTPRTDDIIGRPIISSSNKDIVHMGDLFCLRNKNGDYLCSSMLECLHIATAGSSKNKICLEFTPGSGKLTHGSFGIIKSHNPHLGLSNLLNAQTRFGCIFSTDKHTSGQWWTIKSLENPVLGADICFGDRVYIDNHIYLDTLQLIPGRLTNTTSLIGQHLIAKPIIYDDSESLYWFIERP